MIKQILVANVLLITTSLLWADRQDTTSDVNMMGHVESTVLSSHLTLDNDFAAQSMRDAYALLAAQKPEQALDGIQPAIQNLEAYLAQQQQKIFAANNLPEQLLYLGLAAKHQTNAKVIPAVWADLYFIGAFAEIERYRYPQAYQYLAKALQLSPYNSEYLSQIAFLQQTQHDWITAIGTLNQALSYIEFIQPEQKRQLAANSILRSLGVVHIELAELEKAREYFLKVLQTDPQDQRALQELAYIEQLKLKGTEAKLPLGQFSLQPKPE